MNKRTLAILIFAAYALLGWSCANQTVGGDTAANVRTFVNNVEPSLRPVSAMACSLVLSFAVSPADQSDVKSDLYVVASIVQAATPDTAPGDLSKAIQAAVPKTQQYKTLADSIAGAWAIALPYLKQDSTLLLKVTGDIAGGITDVAKS